MNFLQQETTTKSLIVENPSRIVTVSKVGAICVWDFDLRLLKVNQDRIHYGTFAVINEGQLMVCFINDIIYEDDLGNLEWLHAIV